MKFKKRYLIPLILIAVVALGPGPGFSPLRTQFTELTVPLDRLEQYVQKQEAAEPLLKPDNEARIYWADSVRQTAYSIVYLHGFSASPMEASPLHRDLAQRFGANLYTARLAGHGLNTKESFADLTPNQLLRSAEEALAIGRKLGKKVILMSCSTGGTLSIYLAAKYPELVDALLLYSPNIALGSNMAKLLTGPWGYQILQQIQGPYWTSNRLKGTPAEQYWTTTYRTSGLIALQSLLDQTMTDEVFSAIEQPVLMVYYYKNEEEKDAVVSVDAMLDFFEKINTSKDEKWNRPLADVQTHALVSPFQSQNMAVVEQVSIDFLLQVMKMKSTVD